MDIVDVSELLGPFGEALNDVFENMRIAEEEIELAMKRHGEKPPEDGEHGRVVSDAGPIWNAFALLRVDNMLMPEHLYRQHCKEILDRVALGRDTREPTGAEMLIALSETSLKVPLNSAATGLYLKLMTEHFPEAAEGFSRIGLTVRDYERLHGQEMEEYEAHLRRALRQDWRTPEN